MSNKNLYDYRSYFKLIIGAAEYYIDEPANWDKISIDSTRDLIFFGFNESFINDKQQLIFASDKRVNEDTRQIYVAYNLVKQVYDTDGGDGQIVFEFGRIIAGIPTYWYRGNLNLNNYHNEDGEITCSVERLNFNDLIRTRFESNISLNSALNLDQGAIVPATELDVKMRSRSIVKEFKAAITTPVNVDHVDLARFVSVQLDTTQVVVGELGENEGLPVGISGIDPIDEFRFFFKALESGKYTLNATAQFYLYVQNQDGDPVGNYFFQPRVRVYRGASNIYYSDHPSLRISGDTPAEGVTIYFNGSFTDVLDLLPDDVIYLDLVGAMQTPGSTYRYDIGGYTSTVQLIAQTTAANTTTKCYRLFDALNYMIESATGQANSLKSSVLDVGGRAYNYIITNGYQLRNFSASDKPVIENLQDIINDLATTFGLGQGYVTIAGKDYLVLEDIDWFFQNRQIARINAVYDYFEDHADKLTYNAWSLGYEKYPDSSPNTLDEYNTYHDYLNTIKSFKATLIKKSKMITAGYLIESQRRQQFSSNPSESLPEDDSIFLIAINQDADGNWQSEANEAFTSVTGIYSPETAMNLRITPARMAFNWAPYTSISLVKKPGTDKIANTFAKNNNTLVSELSLADPYRKFEPSFPVNEGEDYTVADYTANNRAPLFMPTNATFKAELKFDFIRNIIEKLRGDAQTVDDRGYIVHPDEYGVYWKSYVFSIKYTPTTEVAEFQVAKKELF